MKIKRYKRVQKYLSFYKNNFSFRAPFQVLIDGTFCQMALKNKVNITQQMPKYLNDSVKLFTTVCVVEETQRLSSSLYGAMIVVKQFNVRKCGHEKSPIAANECLLSLIKPNNSEHYLLATQDSYLSDCARKLVGCPLIYMKMNTIVMEKPNLSSKSFADKANEQQIDLPEHQFNVLKQLKRKQLGESDHLFKDSLKKRRKGPKGANPLSCKKKKKKVTNNSSDNQINNREESNNHKRKRKRVPKHIKRLFDKIETINQN